MPAHFAGASLSFISADEGWVLGTAPCSTSRFCTSLLRTTDGGRSWVGIPAPRADLTGNDISVSSIRFAGARIGFAFDPGLWVTSDGGAHWTLVSSLPTLPHFTVESLAATADGDVYALASGVDSSGDPRVTLLRATRGSTDLRPVTTFKMSLAGATPMLTTAGARVYVTLGTQSLLGFGPGGERRTTLPLDASGDGSCLLASSSATALLAVCGSIGAGAATGTREVFGTTDGGAHWRSLPPTGKGAGYGTTGVAETTNGRAVIATSSGVGAALLATQDGARTWHTALSYPSAGGQYFKDLGFENDQDGSVIYDPPPSPKGAGPLPVGRLLRTTDGGASWHVIPYRQSGSG